MSNQYVPELGQAAFGQPFKQFEVSEIVEAALWHIEREWERVMWNTTQREQQSPWLNTGREWSCDTFSVAAYSWSDDEQPWNFKWRNVEISWYKYCGRGMSANVEISPELASEMLEDCLSHLRKMDEDDDERIRRPARETLSSEVKF